MTKEVWFNTIYEDGTTVIQAKIGDMVFQTLPLNDEELQKFWDELK